MSQSTFLKCPCRHCGGPIEFPPHGVGLKIECPHCGQKTILGRAAAAPGSLSPAPDPMPDPAPEPVPTSTARSRAPRQLALVLVIAIVAGAGGALWWFGRKPGADATPPQAPTVAGKLAALAASDNAPAPTDDAVPESTPRQPKSLDDLKPGPVTLEKARSGSLVHAVGTVKNESDHQRFGVKVEIEFTDAQGRPAGKATDYTQVIEPRREWRFRALVLDARAASGKVVSLKEDH